MKKQKVTMTDFNIYARLQYNMNMYKDRLYEAEKQKKSKEEIELLLGQYNLYKDLFDRFYKEIEKLLEK